MTVETAFLQRIYVLFFISLANRRIEYIAADIDKIGLALAPGPAPEVDPGQGHAREQEQHQRRTADVDGA